MTVRMLTSALAVLVTAGTAGPAPAGDPARARLASAFELRSGDLARIDAGEVFSRTLPSADRREVATLGVVRVGATPEFYVEQFGDIATFKQDEAVLQIGGFSDPPVDADLAGLTLDAADIEDLRECRVGDCGLQLTEGAIERFRRQVDWRRADAPEHATSTMRSVLAEYASQYLRGGAPPMAYVDDEEPLDLREEFASLAASAPLGWEQFPQLLSHLVSFPAGRSTRPITDLLYWSKEKVGRRTVISITHLAIVAASPDPHPDYAVASKQVFGTHYYDASLGLTVLLRDRTAASPVTYLAYFNRSRVDVFHGLFGAITRAAVTSRARSTVADSLARLKLRLEREFAARVS